MRMVDEYLKKIALARLKPQHYYTADDLSHHSLSAI
jgi:hypothetical protein